MTTLYFITTNSKKFEDVDRRLTDKDFQVEMLSFDLNEGRSLDINEIAATKLAQAKAEFPDKKILVEDRGFFIPALNGFPGPFVKIFLRSIGIDGLLRLMNGKSDRTAQFISVLGYFDGKNDHFFVDIEEGFLLNEPKGDNMHGWPEILRVYGYHTFPGRSLAELDDTEWEEYLKMIEKDDHIEKFKRFLRT